MDRQLIAHRDTSIQPERFQSLEEHSRNVSYLCGKACHPIGLENLGKLSGLLHDMGKASPDVQDYLYGKPFPAKLNHSGAGMRWIWETFKNRKQSYRLASQMAAIAIGCHHGTRCDIFSPDTGNELWLERMYSEKADSLYYESVHAFFASCIPESEVIALMDLAAKEVLSLYQSLNTVAHDCISSDNPKDFSVSLQFMIGFAQRFLFAALVDADWSDTATFTANTSLAVKNSTSWNALCQNVEHYLENLPAARPIDTLRHEISLQCKITGQNAKPGIYRLYVPTGGGKTYAGLRYCIHAAQHTNASRIFYFAPYRSIIGQNTSHFRQALGGDEFVLEHHSDVIQDEAEHEALLPFTQRWQGVPMIATTMVQFLNTLFAAPRKNARRLPSLSNAILFFDEIQALPTCHTYLFNLAINFLSHKMGCIVVLCTATQPALEQLTYPLHAIDLVPDYAKLFDQFKRTQIVPLLSSAGFSSSDFAKLAQEKLTCSHSILLIFNTRSLAEKLYDQLTASLGDTVTLVCLTTHLCPQHRMDLIHQIKQHLDLPFSKKIVCISTQLIEAGVDLSFDCVIRSMAGLPSVAQAAGRCNRNGETSCREVYLVPCSPAEEHLERLADLDEGRRATERLLASFPDSDLLSPETILNYYKLFYAESHQTYTMQGPTSSGMTLLDLFSQNASGVQKFQESHNSPLPILRQAFDTAESSFHALDSDTISVVVPYQRGQEIISQLMTTEFPSATLLRDAQHYTVELYRNEFDHLNKVGAIQVSPQKQIYFLNSLHYDAAKGVCLNSLVPEILIY